MRGGYTQAVPTPTPGRLFFSFVVVSLVIFLRPPWTNFIFDEQEALLGNPILTGEASILRVFELDFWGRPPKTTIGSYRPLPNILWWPLSWSLERSPWLLLLVNHAVHAATSTLFALGVAHLGARANGGPLRPELVWAAGLLFVGNALSTEAVCSAVGLADLLVGLFSVTLFWLCARSTQGRARGLLALAILSGAVFFLGLSSKETMLGSLALIPLFFVFGTFGSEDRAWRFRSGVAVFLTSSLALVGYVGLRGRFYAGKVTDFEPLLSEGPQAGPLGWFFSWFAQPVLPRDPMNNPLLEATTSERLATAAQMFLQQSAQALVPLGLCSDYSYPRQPIVDWGPVPLAGALLFFSALGFVAVTGTRISRGRDVSLSERLGALGAGWLALTYLPISNALVLLPTIRADRLMYVPTVGIVLCVLAVLLALLPRGWRVLPWVIIPFVITHAVAGRVHALHYTNDSSFWRAASRGDPASAKSHLNLGVMLGARGDHPARLLHTKRAVSLAPDWPLGQIYLADTYCRLGEMDRAMEIYLRGLSMKPNSKALTALSLQCIWDKGAFESNKHRLMDLAARHPDTWLDYFVYRLTSDGDENDGIPAEYRPRKYNQRGARTP